MCVAMGRAAFARSAASGSRNSLSTKYLRMSVFAVLFASLALIFFMPSKKFSIWVIVWRAVGQNVNVPHGFIAMTLLQQRSVVP